MSDPPAHKDEYRCPACGTWSHEDRWTETAVPCDDCGDHRALRCPECEEPMDALLSHDSRPAGGA